jgi:4a-hydroxytetrahydrobiopterin dehydratase
MSDIPLAERRCLPCEGGIEPLGSDQLKPLLAQLYGWSLQEAGGHQELAKGFKFRNFVEAVDFVNRITPIAEAEGHHPDLEVSWGRVGVRLWTHVAGGLTENDFVLAAKIDRLPLRDA